MLASRGTDEVMPWTRITYGANSNCAILKSTTCTVKDFSQFFGLRRKEWVRSLCWLLPTSQGERHAVFSPGRRAISLQASCRELEIDPLWGCSRTSILIFLSASRASVLMYMLLWPPARWKCRLKYSITCSNGSPGLLARLDLCTPAPEGVALAETMGGFCLTKKSNMARR